MYPRYSKAEIIDRYYWTNNFRIILGIAFFAIFILFNFFRVDLPENIYVLMLIGLFILFYGLLTYYYLKAQNVSLNEIIFLSTFLVIMDLLCLTVFVYFSGGHQSLAFIGYFLVVAVVPFWAPYIIFSPLFWALFSAFLYDGLLLLVATKAIPFIALHQGVTSLGPADIKGISVNAITIPTVLILFAIGEIMILKYMRSERAGLEERLDHEKEVEKRYASFSSVFWILTHALGTRQMLKEALDKLLEILSLRSGMILLLDPKKGAVSNATRGIPEEMVQAIRGKQVKEIDDIFANLQGIFVGKEFIQKELIKKLVFHGKTMGFLILFSKEDSLRVSSDLRDMLDAVADEMAAAVYYGKLFRRIRAK